MYIYSCRYIFYPSNKVLEKLEKCLNLTLKNVYEPCVEQFNLMICMFPPPRVPRVEVCRLVGEDGEEARETGVLQEER